MKNGKYIHEDGSGESWYKDGVLHREDGPAVIFTDSTMCWIVNGRYHREDGPAIYRASGEHSFYLKGKRYDNIREFAKITGWSDKQLVEYILRN